MVIQEKEECKINKKNGNTRKERILELNKRSFSIKRIIKSSTSIMKKQRKEEEEEEEDRISQLPQPLLHHILCFLSQKQALQSCVLSKSWRHLGPTRPKIEFCEDFFNRSDEEEKSLSVVDKTLQRYHDQNLPIQEFIISGMKHGPKSFSLLENWIPKLVLRANKFHLSIETAKKFPEPDRNLFSLPSVLMKAKFLEELVLKNCQIGSLVDDDKVLCTHLRKLYLHAVYITDGTLEKIISSCPLIEDLGITMYEGLQTIKLTSVDGKVLCKNLRKLSLRAVYISDEALEKITSSCPLFECLDMSSCKGFETIKMTKAHNLKFFLFFSRGDEEGCHRIEIDDAPRIETISIHNCLIRNCPNWIHHPNMYFPRLKSLYLFRVRLSNESIEKFSTNLPCLENLRLYFFSDSEQFKLSSRSIKHLTIEVEGSSLKTAIFDAPNILCFDFSCKFLPSLFSFTTTSTEWKSKVCVGSTLDFDNGASSCFHRLSEICKALSTSQISLQIRSIPLVVPDTRGGLYQPLVIENLSLEGDSFFSVPNFLKCLFRNFRPRNIETIWFDETPANQFIKSMCKILLLENERAQHFGQQNLEDVKMEARNHNDKEWRAVDGTSSFSDFALPGDILTIRFRLKWRKE